MSFSRHNIPLRGDPGDPDHRSVRIAFAAALLRHGRTPAQASVTSDVPFALVEWLAEHIPPPECGARGIADRAQLAAEADEASVPALSAAATAESRAGRHPARRRIQTVVAFRMGWRLNCVLAVIAVLFRQPAVGAITVALSMVLMVASAIVIATHLRRRRRPSRQ